MKKFLVEMRNGDELEIDADTLVLLDGSLCFINHETGGSLDEPFKIISSGRWDLATDITDRPESEGETIGLQKIQIEGIDEAVYMEQQNKNPLEKK